MNELTRYDLHVVTRYSGDGEGDIETDADIRPKAKGKYVSYEDHLAQLAALQGGPPSTPAATDVLAERQRQITDEGWDAEHDDEHDSGELAAAACAYALYAADELHPQSQGDGDYGRVIPPMWPFHISWYKPEDPRRALVKAAALILAEIERIDRGAT
jgi:hypothetical protein